MAFMKTSATSSRIVYYFLFATTSLRYGATHSGEEEK